MPFQFVCPYCYHKTRVDDRFAGQSGRCVNCDRPIEMPSLKQPMQDGSAVGASAGSLSGSTTATMPKLIGQRPLQGNLILRWGLRLGVLSALGLFLWFVVFQFLQPTLQGLKDRRDRFACASNIRRIAKALREYEVEFGTLPPPTVYNDRGQKMHSWRVLILPQLGYSDLYASFDLDQPWDSQGNTSAAVQACPIEYLSPAAGQAATQREANYFLLTGPGTYFPPVAGIPSPRSLDGISDGADRTLLLVESDNTMRLWSEPVDIDVQKMRLTVGSPGLDAVGGTHQGGAVVAFGDGTAAWLADDLPPQVLQSLISTEGGEPVDPTAFPVR